MTIDPSTCEPGLYRIAVSGDEVDALRLSRGNRRWATESLLALGVAFFSDDEVTVIRRADEESQPWETLRDAAKLADDPTNGWSS